MVKILASDLTIQNKYILHSVDLSVYQVAGKGTGVRSPAILFKDLIFFPHSMNKLYHSSKPSSCFRISLFSVLFCRGHKGVSDASFLD